MKKTAVIFSAATISFFLAGCNPTSISSATGAFNRAMDPVGTATGAPTGGAGSSAGGSPSTAPVTYKNSDRHFSVTIPKGWAKQNGDVNSERVLFMRIPISDSCSFQFHMTRMQLDFPAEASVKASLNSAKKDIKIDKVLTAKRRDESGKANGKKVYARGWELVQKPKPGEIQRIIYQAYDKDNYYFNFMSAASSPEQFQKCQPQLQQIIDSISFGD